MSRGPCNRINDNGLVRLRNLNDKGTDFERKESIDGPEGELEVQNRVYSKKVTPERTGRERE